MLSKTHKVGGNIQGFVATDTGGDDIQGQQVGRSEDEAGLYRKSVGGARAFHGGDGVHEGKVDWNVLVEVQEETGKFFLGVEVCMLLGFVVTGKEAKGVFDGPGKEHETMGFKFGEGNNEVRFKSSRSNFHRMVSNAVGPRVFGKVLPFSPGTGADIINPRF